MKTEPIRVFELGLGTNNINLPSNMGADGKPGASLYGWAEFFPNASIFGADIDKDILFNTDRINTFYCDQRDPLSIQQMWDDPLLRENFDIIVEDGLHEYSANVCFFENSMHKLKKGGYFIIEDVSIYNPLYQKITEWSNKYTDCSFSAVIMPSIVNNTNNQLLVVNKL